MTLKSRGKNILKAEILNISSHGIWVGVLGKEYFLAYSEFPWFKNARLVDIYDVVCLHGHHLHWKQLDVDVDINSLNNLEKYSLIAR